MAISTAAASQQVPTTLASAKHTAGHRKYGDPLESYRRLAEALDLAGC